MEAKEDKNMDLARQIKKARLAADLTQEMLAEQLGVSPQAVSKWECGSTSPDIYLLPALADALGISLDGLFSNTREEKLERVEAILANGIPGPQDFLFAERTLKDALAEPGSTARAWSLLAALYTARSDQYLVKAREAALEALRLDPEEQDNHSFLCRAWNGALNDWCCTNHNALIDYYYGFIKQHPDSVDGHRRLLDNLIADTRLEEAEQILEVLRKTAPDFRIRMYAAWIKKARGDVEGAEQELSLMIEEEPENWLLWSLRGDFYAQLFRLDPAVADYRKSLSLQEKPRLVDNLASLADLYVLKGEKAEAKQCLQELLNVLASDWGIVEGDTVRRYRERMEAL